MIIKLTCYGVKVTIAKWIESFLVGRFQFEHTGSSVYNNSPVLGVVACRSSQGGILGPVLFVVYVNEIPEPRSARGVSVKLFADDTKLYFVLQDDNVSFVDL